MGQGRTLRRPKMILFDYGQTLLAEDEFDSLSGARAILALATENPTGITAEELDVFIRQLNQDMLRYPARMEERGFIEVHHQLYQNYLFDYFGLRFDLDPDMLETAYWDAYAPAHPVEGAGEMLRYLNSRGIRTGVISNITFSGKALSRRIRAFFPDQPFDFILASSEYVFRKPHPRLFEVALRKAGLAPEEVWFCGDNPLCDVDGAAQCGMTAIWYCGALRNEVSPPQEEHIRIDCWQELCDLLMEIENTMPVTAG